MKNDGHFRIPQISLKQFSTFAKMQFLFFTKKGGGQIIKDFRKTEKLKKNGQFSFFC